MDPQSSQTTVSAPARMWSKVQQNMQFYLDKSTPHIVARWAALVIVLFLYVLRVWFINGFYIISYGLGIYNLNLLLGFLTPQVDPESDGPDLPTKADEEFRPFVRRLPEFKFWHASIKSFFIGFIMTFFSVFDVPVFWPILLLYWFILFFVTMKRQIRHMIKHKYIPFTLGKKKYGAKGKGDKPMKDSK
jgi:hypothetical protein